MIFFLPTWIAIRQFVFAAVFILPVVLAPIEADAWHVAFGDAHSEGEDNRDTDPQAQSTPSSPPQPQPSTTASKPRRIECAHPADPCRRHMVCKSEHFDWDEVLVSDWSGIRSKMRDLGLSLTVSYTEALQTNVSGGPHQIWGYTGQLVAGLNFDLSKLIKVRGMSLYFGGSWGTGDNRVVRCKPCSRLIRSIRLVTTWEKCICNRRSLRTNSL